MPSFPNLSFPKTISTDVFNQLGELLEQMAQSLDTSSLVLTEDILMRIPVPGEWQRQRFTLVVSPGFNGLLRGEIEEDYLNSTSIGIEIDRENIPMLASSLMFDVNAIASFILELKNLFSLNSQISQNLEYHHRQLAPNDAQIQERFTLLLLSSLLTPEIESSPNKNNSNASGSVCAPIEAALLKQISQEKLLNQVTTQIRKSLDLSVIIQTAINQVRKFLELDRLVVYKFGEAATTDAIETSHQQETINYIGCIVYETIANQTISSVLNYCEETCFQDTTECWNKYSQGFTLAIDNVEESYHLEPCLLNFLRQSQVKAKLIAPIVFENKLWGLLIAHQCSTTRNWTESEKILLSSVGEQLAIAIQQAGLMQSLTQEKENLEQRVFERTMALHDALAAAEAASRIRSEFLATISHELLTPLTYVIGMSDTLLKWSFGELSERQRNYLQTIHDSGEHLLEMIHDILDLSQIEAGKAALNISEFSLTTMVEKTTESLKTKAAKQQINFTVDIQFNQERDRFTADARRIQQILENLLSNAIKFTPEQGSVILRIWREENNAVFQIEDTGIGIPEEQQPRLFEKFHQLETNYSRKYEGTGLGLALTKQLVEMHRGRIEVESTVDIGSIFTVWIPVQVRNDEL
ncbi:GAF domain-containing protein [Calothrix sp. PCC 6303]|uniref:GAF domain-containing sensor histidine kinase n=1 Tax=Calothrix sp. PCC 6303 TaxID=1170562 RepID=UPI0002A006FB|nr:GAF domain-containing protein [Calothrix sp. PCC 6303]AFZ01940.1 GAF sensor signal transduction histidine kinase [Calothrix sp. PCC 6303]